MAGHPLRPATRRRLGRPSPHQQADRPRAHPQPKNFPPHPMRGKVISGIRPSFPGLSQSEGQVTHVLLTRSPLVYPRRGLTARLACVKHAASVRPEPGSNSPTKTGPTIAPRTGPRRLNVQTGTKPVHEQARHTVEFSRDTRTPSSAVRRPSGAVPPLYTSRSEWIRGVPVRGAVSGPC